MSWILSFLRSTRAGATALTAAAVTVMTVAGTGFVVDHVWLVSQRDLLKAAADSASVAATQRLGVLPAGLQEAAVAAELQAVAERYVRFNLEGNLGTNAPAPTDVAVTIDINRPLGIVGVDVTAPVGRHLFGNVMGRENSGPIDISVGAGAEAGSGAIWAVLALDVSRTMGQSLDGGTAGTDAEKRINIVRAAAKEFVAAVGPDPIIPVAIGVVPWAWSVYGVLSPSTTTAAIESALDRLNASGSATASSRGLKRSRELLAAAPQGARRVIVLLTDGEDNRSVTDGSCGGSRAECPKFRKAECDGAKQDGVSIFVIAAMANTAGALAGQLRECASSEAYAFINTKDAQAMRDTFGQIAGQIQPLRRTH